MEPRIATLLEIPHEERILQESMSQIRLPSSASRPHPVEPLSGGDDTLMLANTLPGDFNSKYPYRAQLQTSTSSNRPGPGAPIAQVLNNEATMLHNPPPGATAPFSGRLVDLLLDGSEEISKRREWEQRPIQTGLPVGEGSVIKLPKLPQLPQKTVKRPRIPPLLQGLHQPPPLPPEGRLFPPITSENNAFPRGQGERLSYDTYIEEIPGRTEDIRARPGTDVVEVMARVSQSDKTKGEHREVLKILPLTSATGVKESAESNRGTLLECSGKKKRNKKRNKWSETETRNLLVGVSRFGIGNWKKILQDPEFEFNGRTAVDWYQTLCSDSRHIFTNFDSKPYLNFHLLPHLPRRLI